MGSRGKVGPTRVERKKKSWCTTNEKDRAIAAKEMLSFKAKKKKKREGKR